MDNQTSDERLLKIIEGSEESRKAGGNLHTLKKPFGAAITPKFNLAVFKSVFKKLKINLAKINTVLIVLGTILTLIFIFTLFSAPTISKSNAAYFNPADSAAVLKFIAAGQAQGQMRKSTAGESLKRNYFTPASQKTSSISADETAAVLDEVKDLKLVGIIWSSNPEVMIENAKDSRTYTLKKGDSFNEQFKIKDISRNSAVIEVSLGADTREYELR